MGQRIYGTTQCDTQFRSLSQGISNLISSPFDLLLMLYLSVLDASASLAALASEVSSLCTVSVCSLVSSNLAVLASKVRAFSSSLSLTC